MLASLVGLSPSQPTNRLPTDGQEGSHREVSLSMKVKIGITIGGRDMRSFALGYTYVCVSALSHWWLISSVVGQLLILAYLRNWQTNAK